MTLERDMIKATRQWVEWLCYLFILCIIFPGCTQHRVNITNTPMFKRDMDKFNKLEAMRTPNSFDIGALANRMIGPIPTTQKGWQEREKLISVWGQYLP